METTEARTEEMCSMASSDFVFKVIKGAGRVGGYIHNILADTIYFAGKSVAVVRSVYSGIRSSRNEEKSEEGKLTIIQLVRSDAEIDEADRKEFYMNFGRDMVEITKTGIESENLTVIDLSKYKM
jgi:hypothetical protein